MANDHGLSGLFGDDGQVKTKPKTETPAEELPPVLDDADKTPLDLLARKIGLEEELKSPPPPPEEPEARRAPARRREAEPAPAPAPGEQRYSDAELAEEMPAHDPFGQWDDAPAVQTDIDANPHITATPTTQQGILCFLFEGDDGRGRKRTLEALNVAAGLGLVRLRSVPIERQAMNEAVMSAVNETDCAYVAFLTAGTEPADDWAVEVTRSFERQPRAAAVSVRAANSDPLSPWARVSFFMDEAERQLGIAQGFDTVVFKTTALRELGHHLGDALWTGALVPAVQGRGHRIGEATEARVSLVTPSKRSDVMEHVKDQARLAARHRAKGRGAFKRWLIAAGIMLGYPFRVLAVRSAAKRSVGGAQFREVGSKAAMAIFTDRRVRAATMLKGSGKG